jgi:hypothetical protein
MTLSPPVHGSALVVYFVFLALIYAMFAAFTYRSSERFSKSRGSTPWRMPSMFWSFVVVMLGPFIGGLLFLLARVTTDRRLARAGTGAVGGYPAGQIPVVASPVAGWYPDPSTRHELRYWDGRGWSEHVMDGGSRTVDPV